MALSCSLQYHNLTGSRDQEIRYDFSVENVVRQFFHEILTALELSRLREEIECTMEYSGLVLA